MEIVCRVCNVPAPHKHLHNTAYGIADTHMAGSEHFECSSCNCVTFIGDDPDQKYPFKLDRPNGDRR